jgi:hypothetical protein
MTHGLDGVRIIGPDDGRIERDLPGRVLREMIPAGDTGGGRGFRGVVAEPDDAVWTDVDPGPPSAVLVVEREIALDPRPRLASDRHVGGPFVSPGAEHRPDTAWGGRWPAIGSVRDRLETPRSSRRTRPS